MSRPRYAGTMSRVKTVMNDLDARLGRWVGRAPGARTAASSAVADIDVLLSDLHRIRAQLVSEIRAHDGAGVKA